MSTAPTTRPNCPGPLVAPTLGGNIMSAAQPICGFGARANFTLPDARYQVDCCRNGTTRVLDDGCLFTCQPKFNDTIYINNCFRQSFDHGPNVQPVVSCNDAFNRVDEQRQKGGAVSAAKVSVGTIGLAILVGSMMFGGL
ncbi:Hypothetical protein D9617_1g083490 [Elsinoe fawcettii]|nr:Hypothetical protein D9617_1g083490 [Elsinoe fawcettii]